MNATNSNVNYLSCLLILKYFIFWILVFNEFCFSFRCEVLIWSPIKLNFQWRRKSNFFLLLMQLRVSLIIFEIKPKLFFTLPSSTAILIQTKFSCKAQFALSIDLTLSLPPTITIKQYPLADILLSSHHLYAWKCLVLQAKLLCG